jgi:hypothetical protein
MPLLVARIGSQGAVFMAADTTGPFVAIHIDLKARVFISTCSELEQIIRANSDTKLD